uniref:RNA recognition motif-containing protein n=1 Tax=Neospora caninum (strain Liverpool) TaxID=572307 RepID=A0A0F7UJ61_NEOCL|nr:TPA: RNA recognition motif-containing protein [Neospora caninum Liverpool]
MAASTLAYGYGGTFASRFAAEAFSSFPVHHAGIPRPDENSPADDVIAPGDTTRSSSTGRPKERRTLWMGDLDRAELPVDEAYVRNDMFLEFNAFITHVRVCRDRITRLPSFGFVEFATEKHASYVLEHMNGRFVPGRCHKYKLNWANFNLTEKPETKATFSRPPELSRPPGESVSRSSDSAGRRTSDSSCRQPQGNPPADSTSVWVGSLDPATSREEIEELFEQHYKTVCFVKLITDPNTGIGRGFGFVHFRDPDEAERALGEMNGAICRGRRIRVNRSNNSRASAQGTSQDPSVQSAMAKLYAATAYQAQKIAQDYCGGFVPTKRKRGVLAGGTTAKVVVRGLDPFCSEEEVERHLSHFGEIIQTKAVPGGKAYVTFAEQQAAENAVTYLSGCFIGANRVGLEHADAQPPENGGPASEGQNRDGVYYWPQTVASMNLTANDGGCCAPSSYGTSCFRLTGASGWNASGSNYVGAIQGWGEVAGSADTQPVYNACSTVADMDWQPDSLRYAQNAASGDCGGAGQIPGLMMNGGLIADPLTLATIAAQKEIENRQREHAKRKGLIAASDAELSGGLFHDVDPAMVPADLLPAPMMADQAILTKGTLERHTFVSSNPLFSSTLRLRGPSDDDGFMELIDEAEGCEAVIKSDHERLVAAKQKAKARMHEEDHEILYGTTYTGHLPL